MNPAPAAAQSCILATAGHVDHGKSSLVRALTGTDPDRLPEEKARGITIDLGFAHLDLETPPPAGTPEEARRRFSCGLVDVPGHEDFVGNMVSGVGAIDLALVTVAADDGWMPQTEEHLQILMHLGVRHAVFALTKSDLCQDIDRARADVRRHLQDTPFAGAAIVPTSVPTGAGLEELRLALAQALTAVPPAPDLGKPRLWIDRVFSLPGAGTIVTGTLTGGSLKSGDDVVLLPGGGVSPVRSCHSHGHSLPLVRPGMRAGLNLPALGTDATGPVHLHARRGEVVTRAGLGSPSRTLDVRVDRFARGPSEGGARSIPLHHGAPVLLQLGSARIAARVHLLDRQRLLPGETGVAQLRLATPIFAFAGDRFVLRDESRRWTLAGGVVLDPDAARARSRAPARLQALKQGADPIALVRLQATRHGCLPAHQLLRQSRWAPASITTALATCLAQRSVVLAGPWVVDAALLGQWRDRVRHQVQEHHATHPAQPGLPLSELRSRLRSDFPACDAAFPELCALLGGGDLCVEAGLVRLSSHHATTSPAERDCRRRLLETLERRGLDAPGPASLATDALSRSALRELIREGRVVELGAEALLTADHFQAARQRVLAHLSQQGSATVSELRVLLGTNRRILVPLLERMDREGMTRRDGDLRRPGPRLSPNRPSP